MITYQGLGYSGRLGNQMFQYAALLGIANKLNSSPRVPIENSFSMIDAHLDLNTGQYIKSKLDLLDCFNVTTSNFVSKNFIKTTNIYQERFFHFDDQVFNINDNTDLHGYYQSDKYFNHCSDLIRKEFTFKDAILNKCKDMLMPYSNTVSIHVRRGDYVGLQNHHPLMTAEYYQNSLMNYFGDDEYTFLVFSDDISWCKGVFPEGVIFMEGNSQFEDMCLMSLCNHNIIANSSFSWWAAWLNNNKDKKVIAPKTWFGPAYYHYNTNDLYPTNYITL